MVARGNKSFPLTTLKSGRNFAISSRDIGREIPCRLIMPNSKSKAILLYMHGGSWILSNEKRWILALYLLLGFKKALWLSELLAHLSSLYSFNPYLKSIADGAYLAVVSVGYRLAPEHPFPARPQDCIDAAEWLIKNSKKEYAAELKFLRGEVSRLIYNPFSPLNIIV